MREVTAVTGGSDHTAIRTPCVPGGSYVQRNRRSAAVEERNGREPYGLAIWVADALVVFFLPASVKIGGRSMWLTTIMVLALMGFTLMIVGHVMRGKAEE